MKKVFLTIAVISLFSATSDEENFLQQLRQKLENYTQSQPFIGVQLIFNQNKYAPGDTAFFAIHVYDENFAPIRPKRIFGLSLINAQGKSIQQIKFATVNGNAFNQFAIPSDANSGVLKCLIYAEASGTLLSQNDVVVVENRLKIADESSTSKVLLFPEGGNIICGVKNRVVLKSVFRGNHVVRNNINEVVAQVSIDESGLTHFSFTPDCSASYRVEVENQSETYPVSNSLSKDGISLSVNTLDRESIAVELNVPDQSALKGQQLYMIIVNRRKIAFTSTVDFSSSTSLKLKVPKESLQDGASQISILNASVTVLAERVFYMNRLAAKAELKSPAQSYRQRDGVTQELLVADKYGNPVSGTFSVSVCQKKLFEGDRSPFQDAFYLECFTGAGPHAFNGLLKDKWNAVLDDYLIFKNPKIISWADVLNPKSKSPNAIVEGTLKLKGRAVLKQDNSPVPDSTLIVTYLRNSMIGYEARAIKGNFQLTFLYDFYGDDDLFYFMESQGKDLTGDSLVISQPLASSVSTQQSFLVTKDSMDGYADHQFKKRIIDRSYSFFANEGKEKIKYTNPNEKFEEEMSGVDVTTNVQDFIVFPTMEDLVREVIPYLSIRKSQRETSIRLLLTYKGHNVKPKAEPLFIIDGVLSKDKDLFLNLKPADILTIKLVNSPEKLAQWGALGKNGVVFVSTRRPMAVSRAEGHTIKVHGLNQGIQFPQKDYSNDKNKNQRIPDFRAALYWSPTVKLSESGKAQFSFFTSDMLGEYVVQVRGLTSNGIPFETESTFVVRR